MGLVSLHQASSGTCPTRRSRSSTPTRVDASPDGYATLRVPDAAPGLVGYGVTLILAATSRLPVAPKRPGRVGRGRLPAAAEQVGADASPPGGTAIAALAAAASSPAPAHAGRLRRRCPTCGSRYTACGTRLRRTATGDRLASARRATA